MDKEVTIDVALDGAFDEELKQEISYFTHVALSSFFGSDDFKVDCSLKKVEDHDVFYLTLTRT